MNQNITEATARRMRDMIFQQTSGDTNWDACKDNWMRPDSIAWLIEHSQIDKFKKP